MPKDTWPEKFAPTESNFKEYKTSLKNGKKIKLNNANNLSRAYKRNILKICFEQGITTAAIEIGTQINLRSSIVLINISVMYSFVIF